MAQSKTQLTSRVAEKKNTDDKQAEERVNDIFYESFCLCLAC
jgi:nucleoid DNA-binding protein